jgi:tripartite-type tricarboxylate transporter receptor subunit TctC
VVVDGWFGVVAPTGAPPDIVLKVNHEIGEFLKNPEIHQRLITFGLATTGAARPRAPDNSSARCRSTGARARHPAAVTPSVRVSGFME